MSGPSGMSGLRVLDLSDNVSGAYAARLLATAGAQVTLVEPTAGSALRSRPPLLTSLEPKRSAAFEYLSAWKRGVALDWSTDAGWSALERLLDHSDVVITTLSADQALAFDRRARSGRPALIHVAATSYGLSGPWAGWRSSDLTDWAASGYLYITGDPLREPLQGAGPWASYVAGIASAIGAMAALHARRSNGRGQLVDVGAMEVMASAHQWSLVMWSHQGRIKHRANNRHAEAHHPVSLMQVQDGWVCIAAPTQAQWVNLCVALDLPEMADDPRFATAGLRFDVAEEIDGRFAPFLMARNRTEVVEYLQGFHVPASAVLSMDEMLKDPQLQARAFWAYPEPLGEGVKMPGVPFVLPSSPDNFNSAPRLGADTAQALGEAGMAEDEIAALVEEAVVAKAGGDHD
ncbi:MAG: CoA transferase [Chloroflexi bacterium]|nr:CoA transferase [Chloroflexota bacterium]MYG91010.1 CoA transferase [Chloroflexota bacterium]MYJ92544.1 CoA transferase [Chloroflexota bacterium]